MDLAFHCHEEPKSKRLNNRGGGARRGEKKNPSKP